MYMKITLEFFGKFNAVSPLLVLENDFYKYYLIDSHGVDGNFLATK